MSTRVFASKPAIALPPHEITLAEILADIKHHHSDHPDLVRIGRVVGRVGVKSRRFTRPLNTVSQIVGTGPDEEPIGVRNARAYRDVCELAVQATASLLDEQGISPTSIDAVVTSHSSGIAMPGVDVHLLNTFDMRPDVRRVPATQLGCVAGAHCLVRAADMVRAHPGSTVLVVVAEALSTAYLHTDDSLDAMIYKALFGDSGGAILVSDRPLGPGIEIHDTWEYTLPNTTHRYRSHLDHLGHHFESTSEALLSVGELVPPMLEWYHQRDPEPPAFWVAHTGGPRILDDLAKATGCAPDALQHSWNSLRERGNVGGNAVFDVLHRTYAAPPQDGASGVLIGLGPGFSAAAARITWSN